MNNVSLTGRLVRDPEVRYSQGENPTGVARYTLAVSRPFKSNNGGLYALSGINTISRLYL